MRILRSLFRTLRTSPSLASLPHHPSPTLPILLSLSIPLSVSLPPSISRCDPLRGLPESGLATRNTHTPPGTRSSPVQKTSLSHRSSPAIPSDCC
ncbi:hypothetical protein IE53DRAFT_387606 [Violaceomyces palustris]|uniref:Uncharacterized protein n=1 Tax=Violaceomyces palustris TaxID=1673888 RepID=A0ACD0NWA8_9BASI|nr:hypothetical protein IE53DRAFT_387606 [Violaceomyces palustris]